MKFGSIHCLVKKIFSKYFFKNFDFRKKINFFWIFFRE